VNFAGLRSTIANAGLWCRQLTVAKLAFFCIQLGEAER